MIFLFPTKTSCAFIPTNENCTVAFSGILESVYFPLLSEIVPLVVPFTTTETPGNEAPEESVTLPEMDFYCWFVGNELFSVITMYLLTISYFRFSPEMSFSTTDFTVSFSTLIVI